MSIADLPRTGSRVAPDGTQEAVEGRKLEAGSSPGMLTRLNEGVRKYRVAIGAVLAVAAVGAASMYARYTGQERNEQRKASIERQFETEANAEYVEYCRQQTELSRNNPPEQVGDQMLIQAMHAGDYDRALECAKIIRAQGHASFMFDSEKSASMGEARTLLMRADRQPDREQAKKDYADAAQAAKKWAEREVVMAKESPVKDTSPNWDSKLAGIYAEHMRGNTEEAGAAFLASEQHWQAMDKFYSCMQPVNLTKLTREQLFGKLQVQTNERANRRRLEVLRNAYGNNQQVVVR